MHKYRDIFFKSAYSGIILAIASIVNLYQDNRVAGAFLFSLGLTAIFVLGAYLYTGIVGNTVVMHEFGWGTLLLVVLAGNLAGCLVSALLFQCIDGTGPIVEAAASSWQAKTGQTPWSAFMSSCFCGFLMYTAWRANQKTRPFMSAFVVVLCVMVFVLARFDHSIANSFLMFVSGSFSASDFGYLAVMIAGNSAGAVLPAWIFREKMNKEAAK